MKPAELAKQCVDAINFRGNQALITVVLPKGWKAPPKFPRRRLLMENSMGELVYRLSAMNVLAWLVANKMVGMVRVAP